MSECLKGDDERLYAMEPGMELETVSVCRSELNPPSFRDLCKLSEFLLSLLILHKTLCCDPRLDMPF